MNSISNCAGSRGRPLNVVARMWLSQKVTHFCGVLDAAEPVLLLEPVLVGGVAVAGHLHGALPLELLTGAPRDRDLVRDPGLGGARRLDAALELVPVRDLDRLLL